MCVSHEKCWAMCVRQIGSGPRMNVCTHMSSWIRQSRIPIDDIYYTVMWGSILCGLLCTFAPTTSADRSANDNPLYARKLDDNLMMAALRCYLPHYSIGKIKTIFAKLIWHSLSNQLNKTRILHNYLDVLFCQPDTFDCRKQRYTSFVYKVFGECRVWCKHKRRAVLGWLYICCQAIVQLEIVCFTVSLLTQHPHQYIKQQWRRRQRQAHRQVFCTSYSLHRSSNAISYYNI